MRLSRFASLGVAAALAATGPACKKEEPLPTLPPVEKPAVQPPAAPAAPAAPAVPAAPVIEGRYLDRPAVETSTVAALPEQVMGLAATPSLRQLVEVLAKFGPASEVPASPFEMLLGALKSVGFTQADRIAFDKPLYVGVPNPKTWPEGFFVVATVLDGFDVKTLLPGGSEKDGLVSFSFDGRDLFARLDGTTLQVASHAALLTELAPFIKETLVPWVPRHHLHLDSAIANLKGAFKEEFEAMRADIPAFIAQLDQPTLPDQAAAEGAEKPAEAEKPAKAEKPAEPSQQGRLLGEFANEAIAFIEGADRVRLAFDLEGAMPRLAGSVSFLPGTAGETYARDVAARRATLATAVPDGSWFAFAGEWNRADELPTVESLVALLQGQKDLPLQLAEADLQALAEALIKLAELTGDAQALWLRSEGDLPFVLEGINAVKDAEGWRAALLGLVDVATSRVWAAARPGLLAQAAEGAPKPPESFADAWTMVTGMAQAQGITLATSNTPEAVGLTVDFDWTKIPQTPQSGNARQLLGARYEVGFAAKGERAAVTMGPGGLKRAVEIAGGAATGKDPWLARAATRAFFVLTARPAPLLKGLANLPDLASKKEAFLKVPDLPLTVELLPREGGVQLELELSREVLSALVALGN
jgi:hypothetical protein